MWLEFRDEYVELVPQPLADEILSAERLPEKAVAIMAPSAYWSHWRNSGDRQLNEGWESYRALVESIGGKGFCVTYWQCPDMNPDGSLKPGAMTRANGPWNMDHA